MYAPPEDDSRYQSKMIVNMVVAVFLVIGLLMALNYFNFIYLGDVPLVGGWMMKIYESIFGMPRVLLLHGDDSIGDWTTLRGRLTQNNMFYYEDIDVNKFDSGIGNKLKQFGLVIVEDVKRLDKDKLLSIVEYVKSGGNLIWVGDAGTLGQVEYDGKVLATQTGWVRPIVCIDENTRDPCNCKEAKKENSSCKYLPERAEREDLDFTTEIGLQFNKDIEAKAPQLEIVDTDHWSVAGIAEKIKLDNVHMVSSVSNDYDSALVANINIGDESYPAIVVHDSPSSWGIIVYFAYPPEETMEVLLPIVDRLRY